MTNLNLKLEGFNGFSPWCREHCEGKNCLDEVKKLPLAGYATEQIQKNFDKAFHDGCVESGNATGIDTDEPKRHGIGSTKATLWKAIMGLPHKKEGSNPNVIFSGFGSCDNCGDKGCLNALDVKDEAQVPFELYLNTKFWGRQGCRENHGMEYAYNNENAQLTIDAIAQQKVMRQLGARI